MAEDALSRTAKRWVENQQPQDAEELLELLRPLAYRFVVTITGRPNKPLVEAALAKAVMKAAQWEGRSQFSTWFYSICRREALRASREPEFEELPEQAAEDSSLFWKTLWGELRAKLSEAERELLDARLAGHPVDKARWRKLVRRLRHMALGRARMP